MSCFKKHAGDPTCSYSWRTPSGSACCDIRPCCCVVVAWWERRMRLRGRWRGWRKPSWWLLGVPFLRWVGAAKRWEVKWCLLPNLPRLLYPLKKSPRSGLLFFNVTESYMCSIPNLIIADFFGRHGKCQSSISFLSFSPQYIFKHQDGMIHFRSFFTPVPI